MSMLRALKIILAIALFGVLFSGVLTWRELFGDVVGCPAIGSSSTILGYPACVYGLFMYVLIAAVAAWGLMAARAEGSQRTTAH